jgi:hypothetical protein
VIFISAQSRASIQARWAVVHSNPKTSKVLLSVTNRVNLTLRRRSLSSPRKPTR